MARHRPPSRHAGLRAMTTALACLALAGAVLHFDVADGLTVPPWTVAIPLLLYVAVAALTLGQASLRRRAAWLAGACATHAVFVVTTAAIVAATGSVPLATALPDAIVESPLATIVFVVGVPLTLLPFRGRLLSRPAVRARAPRTAPPAASRGDRATGAPPAGETAFAREARRRVEAARVAEPSAAVVSPAAAVVPPAPPPVVAPARPVARPAPSPVGATARAVVPPMPVRAADGKTVRIPLARIAAQLPPEIFTLPVERLGESMRSPHELLVAHSVVIEQLGEGKVEVAWTLVEDQFPTLGFALETSEIRRRYPSLRVSLPLDLVVPQLPSTLFAGAAPAAEIADLERYPAPFQPSGAEPAPPASPAPPVPAPARTAPSPPAARPAPAAVAPPPVAAPARKVEPVISIAAPAVSTPAPVAAARPIAPAAGVKPTAPVAKREPPAPVRTPLPAPAAAAIAPAALLAEGHRLAAGLTAFGPLEVAAQDVSGTAVLSLVMAGVPHAAVARAAARLAPLLSGAQQVTVHAERVSMVLMPVRGGVLAVGLRAGAPVALLEILIGRACAEGPMASAPAGAPRGLAAAALDGRVAALGGALQGFGPVVPSAFVDRASGLDVYVFSAQGDTAQEAAEAARVVWQALVRESERDLGPALSVVLRDGARRTVVHPVAAARPAMLAAAGVLALPGLAYRQAAHAAERLARA